MADIKKPRHVQLELPLAAPSRPEAVSAPRPGLRVIRGEGKRQQEPLKSRDAVVRVLLEAGADLLLRRISSERASEIEGRVDKILRLFDQVDHLPALMPVLERQLNDLESLMRQTRELRSSRRPASPSRAGASDV